MADDFNPYALRSPDFEYTAALIDAAQRDSILPDRLSHAMERRGAEIARVLSESPPYTRVAATLPSPEQDGQTLNWGYHWHLHILPRDTPDSALPPGRWEIFAKTEVIR